jgi:hypothetical protein
MAAYDLTSTIGSYLDRHLIDPMLEFLAEKKVSVVPELYYLIQLAYTAFPLNSFLGL